MGATQETHFFLRTTFLSGSPSSIPRLTSVCHTAATMSRSGRPNQDASGEYEYVGNPQLQPPKSLNPKIESFA